MVTRSLLITIAAATISASSATGITLFVLHEAPCAAPSSPSTATNEELQRRHQEFFKPQTYDNTHGQEMKPRW